MWLFLTPHGILHRAALALSRWHYVQLVTCTYVIVAVIIQVVFDVWRKCSLLFTQCTYDCGVATSGCAYEAQEKSVMQESFIWNETPN